MSYANYKTQAVSEEKPLVPNRIETVEGVTFNPDEEQQNQWLKSEGWLPVKNMQTPEDRFQVTRWSVTKNEDDTCDVAIGDQYNIDDKIAEDEAAQQAQEQADLDAQQAVIDALPDDPVVQFAVNTAVNAAINLFNAKFPDNQILVDDIQTQIDAQTQTQIQSLKQNIAPIGPIKPIKGWIMRKILIIAILIFVASLAQAQTPQIFRDWEAVAGYAPVSAPAATLPESQDIIVRWDFNSAAPTRDMGITGTNYCANIGCSFSNGAAWFNGAGSCISETNQGIILNQYVGYGINSASIQTTWTISFWYRYPTTYTTYKGIWQSDSGVYGYGCLQEEAYLGISMIQYVYWARTNDAYNVGNWYNFPAPTTSNVWHNIICVGNGTNIATSVDGFRIYIDGVKIYSALSPWNGFCWYWNFQRGGGTWLLGGRNGGFKGALDDWTMWRCALTGTECSNVAAIARTSD